MKQMFVVLLATLLLCAGGVGGEGKKSTGAANQQHPTKDSAGAMQVQSATVAGVPQFMSHQGYVADNTGTGITGALPMTFRMYNDSTGGLEVFTQSFPSVTLTKGIFNVNLDVSSLSFSGQYWLETEVNGETLSPRARLTSAPYSLAPWQTNGTTVYYNGGNVGIGNTAPAHKLDVNGAINATSFLVNGTPLSTGGTRMGNSEYSTSPELGVYGTGDRHAYIDFHASDAQTDWSSRIIREAGVNGSTEIATLGTGVLRLRTWTPGSSIAFNIANSGDKMTIASNGNVGIGTTNPVAKLEVTDALGSIHIGGAAVLVPTSVGLILNSSDASGKLMFRVAGDERMRITSSGNVGIGTTNPQSKLAVNGTITAKQVDVTLGGWSDFVFEDDYKLPDLEAVEQHIKQFKHLPDVPSEKEVLSKGVDLGKMQSILLQKIEELTLYVIELKKNNDALEQKLHTLDEKE